MKFLKNVPVLHKSAFLFFSFLVFVTPLVFVLSIENIYELPKAVMIITAGGLFVMLSLLVLFRNKGEKNKFADNILIESRLDIPVVLLLAAAAISTIFSLKPYVSYMGQYDRQLGLITYIYIFLIYIFSSLFLKEAGIREAITELIQAAGLAVSVYALMQALNIDPFNVPVKNLRVNATFGNANFASGFLVMVFPFMLSSALKGHRIFYRTVSMLLLLTSVAIMQTRSVYIAVIVQTIVVLSFHILRLTADVSKRRRIFRRSMLIMVALIIIGVLLVLSFPANPVSARVLSFAKFSENPRWLLWRDSLRLFLAHPFTGTGISAFSNGFENIISHELRMTDTRGYFDNAHNNFLQVLCTMGLPGGAAYVYLLFRSFQTAVRKYRTKSVSKSDSIILLACIGSLSGYVLFGLADFDDPLILFYLFLMISLVKCSISSDSKVFSLSSPGVSKYRKPAAALALALTFYLGYNIYSSYDVLYADHMYKQAKLHYMVGNINSSIQYLNKAVTANFGCPEYKIMLASYVQNYCFQNNAISHQTRNELLRQAEEEIKRAEVNSASEVNCKSVLTRIYYEAGRTNEADSLKEVVYKLDFASLPLRNYLARHYFVNRDIVKMKEELDAIMKYDPQNIDGNTTAMEYYMSINDFKNAELNCRMILKFDPQNKIALQAEYQIMKSGKMQ